MWNFLLLRVIAWNIEHFLNLDTLDLSNPLLCSFLDLYFDRCELVSWIRKLCKYSKSKLLFLWLDVCLNNLLLLWYDLSLDYNDKIHCFEVNSLRMLKPHLGFTSGFSTSLSFSCFRYNWIIYLDRGSVWSFWFIEIFFVLSLFYKSNFSFENEKKRLKLDRIIFFVNDMIICKLLLEKICSKKNNLNFFSFFISSIHYWCLNLFKFAIVT